MHRAHTPACTACIWEGLPTPQRHSPATPEMAPHHPSPTPCPSQSPTKVPPHPPAAPQEPKLQPEKRPIPSPLEPGAPGTATAASHYLHDDVEGQIEQQVTDEDSQYVGGKVSGAIHQPKDSTEGEDRRDIRQLPSLGTGYIPKVTATHCSTPCQDCRTQHQCHSLPIPWGKCTVCICSQPRKFSHGQLLKQLETPEDRQGPWIASNPWPSTSPSVGSGPRPVHLVEGMSLRSSFREKQEPGAMILGLIRELIPPSSYCSARLCDCVCQASCTLAEPEISQLCGKHNTAAQSLHKLPETQAMRHPQLKCSGDAPCSSSAALHPMDLPTILRSACLPKHVRITKQTLLHLPITPGHQLCSSTKPYCPHAQIHKAPTPQYLQGPVHQVPNNEQHHPVLEKRH